MIRWMFLSFLCCVQSIFASHSDLDKNYIKTSSFIFHEVLSSFALFNTTHTQSQFLDNFASHLKEITTIENEPMWYFSLEKLIVSLQDEHTKVYNPYRCSNTEASKQLPIRLEFWDKKLYVISGKYKAISYLDEITHINNIPAWDFIKKSVYPYESGSDINRRMRKSAISFCKQYSINKVNLRIKKQNGKVFTESIDYKYSNTDLDYPRLSQKKDVQYELSSDIYYLKIPNFKNATPIKTKKNYKSIIVDIRGNTGGNGKYAEQFIVDILGKVNSKTFTHINTINAFEKANKISFDLSTFDFTQIDTNFFKNYIFHHKKYIFENIQFKEIHILHDEDTVSAAEDFICHIKNTNHHVTTWGRKTMGATGQPLFIYLPKGGYVQITTKKDLYHAHAISRNGIEPDYQIPKSWKDFAGLEDKSLQFLVKKINHIGTPWNT